VNRLDLVIEPLGKHHDRARFSCGQPDLDDWFRLRASQDEKRNVARVFVAVTPDLGVVGFYSLSSLSLALESLPEELAHKLPRYDAIPAGELLLADAVQRILGAGRSIAVFAIVVDAKDERAVEFYRAFGFRVFPLQPKRLFLLTVTAAAGLQVVNRL
jgi:hypothetical protein